jgi:hypothetical protein
MPLAGLILNRVHGSPAARLSAARSLAAAETLMASDNGSSDDRGSADRGAHALTIAALRLHTERMQLTAAERRVSEHFTSAHPHVPVAEVPDQPDDVHDLAGLRAVGDSFS